MTIRITFRWRWMFLGQSAMRQVGQSEKHAKKPYVGTFEELLDLDVATVKSIKVLPLNHAQSLERHD
jgi:hypothetical protein